MSVRTANIATSASPQQVFPAASFNVVGTVQEPISVAITNEDTANAVRIGEQSVITASVGFRIGPGSTFSADLIDGDMASLYIIAAAGTPNVSVIATRQST